MALSLPNNNKQVVGSGEVDLKPTQPRMFSKRLQDKALSNAINSEFLVMNSPPQLNTNEEDTMQDTINTSVSITTTPMHYDSDDEKYLPVITPSSKKSYLTKSELSQGKSKSTTKIRMTKKGRLGNRSTDVTKTKPIRRKSTRINDALAQNEQVLSKKLIDELEVEDLLKRFTKKDREIEEQAQRNEAFERSLLNPVSLDNELQQAIATRKQMIDDQGFEPIISYHKIITQSRSCPRMVHRSVIHRYTEAMRLNLMHYVTASYENDTEAMLFNLAGVLKVTRECLSINRAGIKPKVKRKNQKSQLQRLDDNICSLKSHPSITNIIDFEKVNKKHVEQQHDTAHEIHKLPNRNITHTSDNDQDNLEEADRRDLNSIKASRRLLNNGHVSKSIKRLAQSSPAFQEMDQQRLDKLNELHPSPHNFKMPRPEEDTSFITVDYVLLYKLIQKMNNGSSPGLSGLSWEMLKLLSDDDHCLAGLKILVQDIINNRLPSEAKSYLLSANLISFPKNNGGIRPIAIGETIYRLAASYALSTVDIAEAMEWSPLQFGVGIRGGSEKLVHILSNRICVSNQVCVAVDFKNAFNSISREFVLKTFYARPQFKTLFRLVEFSYSDATDLYIKDQNTTAPMLKSQEGVRQGDPLSALLFAVAIHELYKGIKIAHGIEVMSYLDDCYLIARVDQQKELIQAYNDLEKNASLIGLKVQPTKSMLIDFAKSVDWNTRQHFESLNVPMQTSTASVLGTIISKDLKTQQQQLRSQISEQHRTLFRLLNSRHMPAQMTLLFLRMCTTPKLNYLMRVTQPLALQPAIKQFDSHVHEIITSKLSLTQILNHLSLKDKATHTRMISQIYLPIDMSGFGMRRCSDLSELCFYSSIVNCLEFIKREHIDFDYDGTTTKADLMQDEQCSLSSAMSLIIPNLKKLIANDKYIELLLPKTSALEDIQDYIHSHSTIKTIYNLQHLITRSIDKNKFGIFTSEIQDSNNAQLVAHYKQLSKPHTQDWLSTIPTSPILQLDDHHFKIIGHIRLFIRPDHWPNKCPLCNLPIENDFTHALSCVRISKQARHNAIRDLLGDTAKRLGIVYENEPTSMSHDDDRRVDGLFHFDGGSVAADVTVVHPLSRTYIDLDSILQAQTAKTLKYDDMIHPPFVFKALVFSNMGEWGQGVEELIALFRKKAFAGPGAFNENIVLYELVHGLSIQIQRFNAIMTRNYDIKLERSLRERKIISAVRLKSVQQVENNLSRRIFRS